MHVASSRHLICMHCFYAGDTEHIADHAHDSSARAFSLLKFALNPEEKDREEPVFSPRVRLRGCG